MHNWDDFRYFTAVADTGSYSQAAILLGVNHSTVSRRIQALESSHGGVRLFERTTTGYRLTEAGESIYDITQNLTQQANTASRILQGQDARLEGTINLTMPNDIFMFLMAEPLARFSQLHPNISFNMLLSKGLRNMANREADLAIRVTATPPDYLIGTKIVHLQHGLYRKKGLVLNDVTPIITWGSEQGVPEWALQHCQNPRVVLKVDDLFAMHQAVKAGLGIARIPCFIADIVQDPHVERLPIHMVQSDFAVWVLHHQDLRKSAKINQCRNYLKQVLIENKSFFLGEHSNHVFSIKN